MARVLLVVAREPALLDQPAETPLNDPAPGQHDEAFLVFELLDDAECKVRAHAEELGLTEIAELPFLTPSSEANSVALWNVWSQMLADKGWTNTYLAGDAFKTQLAAEIAATEAILKDIGLVQ